MNTQSNPKENPIDAAVRLCPGGRAALAKLLNVTIAAIGNWKMRNSVPVEHCAQIEAATGAQVTRKQLRPNDWQLIWPELATTTKTAQGHSEGC